MFFRTSNNVCINKIIKSVPVATCIILFWLNLDKIKWTR